MSRQLELSLLAGAPREVAQPMTSGSRAAALTRHHSRTVLGVAALSACVLAALAVTIGFEFRSTRVERNESQQENAASMWSDKDGLVIRLHVNLRSMPSCSRRFNGNFCTDTKGFLVSKDGANDIAVGPWTPLSKENTTDTFALSGECSDALKALRSGLYHVTAQLVAQQHDGSSASTLECAVELKNRDVLIGRSLNARRALSCLAVGVLRLSAGDELRVMLRRLVDVAGQDRFRLSVKRPGLTCLQVARIGD